MSENEDIKVEELILRKEYDLTEKQWAFVQHFLHSRSPKQAFMAAYDTSNYSPYNITTAGWQNLRKPKIKKAIASELEKIHKNSQDLYIFDKRWFLQQYENLIEMCVDQNDLTNYNRALSQLAQLMGVNEAMKIESIDTKINIQLDLTSDEEHIETKHSLPESGATIYIKNDSGTNLIEGDPLCERDHSGDQSH